MYFVSDFDFGGTYSSRRFCKVASPGAESAILAVRDWRITSRNSSRETSVARKLKFAHTHVFKTLVVVDRDGVGIWVKYRKHFCDSVPASRLASVNAVRRKEYLVFLW